jgi:enterobactin synthetase component D
MALFPTQLLSPSIQAFSVQSPLSSQELLELEAAGFALPAGLERAVASRKEEFRAGRYCAWRALGKTAIPATGPGPAPVWPEGHVGSIAHARGVAAAACAPSAELASVGIDLEPCMELERATGLRSRLLTAGDEQVVQALRGWSEGDKVTLVFSAKEAIYKGLHPLCAQYFGFQDAELTQVDEPAGTFAFRLLRELPGGFARGWGAQGRFAREGGWIYTALEISARH